MYDCRKVMARGFVKLYAWTAERLYYELAWAYDLVSWLVSLGHWHSWRRLTLDHVIGQHVLEVGFGTGELLFEMARRHLRPYGLERSPAMHRVTSRKMRRRTTWVDRTFGITQRMPFADGSFDSIISTFPTGYILDPTTLREVSRLLRPPDPTTGRPGGRFIVVGLCFETDSRLLRQAMHFVFGPLQENVYAEYERIARAAGLSVSTTAPNNKVLKVPVAIAEKCA